MHQTEVVNLEYLVTATHMYRKFVKLWSFAGVEKQLAHLVNDNQYKGFGILRLFKIGTNKLSEIFADLRLQLKFKFKLQDNEFLSIDYID